MKYKSLIFLFYILPIYVFAQDTNLVSQKYILLRGKAFGSAVIEDIHFRNLSIGAEFRFFRRHSFGIDYVHFRWNREEDKSDGSDEPSIFSRRNYLNFDYRFYGPAYESPVDPYFNAFIKVGKRDVFSEDSTLTYPSENQFAENSHFTDYGLAIGCRFAFGPKDRAGLDVNLGLINRQTHVYYRKYETLDPKMTHENYDFQSTKWQIHMRLNVYFRILSF